MKAVRLYIVVAIVMLVSGLSCFGSLQGHWKYDGDLADSSPNGYTMDRSGTVNFCNAKLNQGIELNSSFGYMFSKDQILFSGDYSVTGWFKTSDSSCMDIISITNNSDCQGILIEINAGIIRYLHRKPHGVSGGVNIFSNSYSNKLYNDNKWHHYAVVNNGLTISLYLDGVLIDSATIETQFDNDQMVIVVGQLNKAEDVRVFNGKLDDIRVYDNAMSEAEIDELSSMLDVIFVDINASGANNGENWPDAYRSLTSALNVADSSKAIWIANGTYVLPDGSRYNCYTIPNGVELYGGFQGGEITFSERNLNGSPAILSGDIDSISNTDDCLRVINANNVDNTTIIDGVEVTRSYSIISAANSHHGAINAENGSPVIRNCRIYDNFGYHAGGIYSGGNGVEISNCIIENNYAREIGGGIFIAGSNTIVDNCTFNNNTAAERAGGVFVVGSNVTVSNCTFNGNEGLNGGAIYTYNYNSIVSNCEFYNNDCRVGGCVYIGYNNTVVKNCLCVGNTASFGGVFYCSVGGDVYLDNITTYGNAASVIGDTAYNNSGTLNIKDSILWDNSSSYNMIFVNFGAVKLSNCDTSCWNSSWTDNGGNISSNPHFYDTANRDFHLCSEYGRYDGGDWVVDGVTSPCIDRGNATSGYGNEPMPNGLRVNMGYYGNTAEASKSYVMPGDIAYDNIIDINDLAIVADEWLGASPVEADVVIDGMVDLADFGVIAERWLEEK